VSGVKRQASGVGRQAKSCSRAVMNILQKSAKSAGNKEVNRGLQPLDAWWQIYDL